MTEISGRVWVTRAEPGATATADRLRAMGLEPLIAPLLKVEAIPAEIELGGVAALAFTSANGVRVFSKRCGRRDLPVFTVGDATAAAAEQAGFAEVRSAAGDVAALAALIAQESPEGAVLCPGAEVRAGDLVGDLAREGVEAQAMAVYRTVSTTGPALRELDDVAAVLIHSPRAAAVLAELAADLSHMAVVGLSDACLEPLADTPLMGRGVAAAPNEDALMQALSVALGISPAGR